LNKYDGCEEMTHAFLLHSKPFKESSVIASFVTDTDGRVDCIARSVRGKVGKKNKPIIPFCLYELSWAGKGELKTLQHFESVNFPISLSGTQLFCGLYLNELLYHLLPVMDADHQWMYLYSAAVTQLAEQENPEPTLRMFEMTLLEMLGYGIDFCCDASGAALELDAYYQFLPEQGLVRVANSTAAYVGNGEAFIAMGNRDFSTMEVRKLAKLTMRSALSVCLGRKKLHSRELFL